MRMWNVNPELMCRKHLLGEHVEMHMFVGCLSKGKSLTGYIKKGLVEIRNIKKRHDELVQEMKSRGYNHNSPLELKIINNTFYEGIVDSDANLIELAKRCKDCAIINIKGD